MTKNDVNYVISTLLGESLNATTPLKSVKYITFDKLQIIYADQESTRFEFDMTNEVVKVYRCKRYLGSIPSNWEVGKQYDTYNGINYVYMFDSELNPYVDTYDFSSISIISICDKDTNSEITTVYSVDFRNYDGSTIRKVENVRADTILDTLTVDIIPTYDDEDFSYSFKGWSLTQNGSIIDPSTVIISRDLFVYAIYDITEKEPDKIKLNAPTLSISLSSDNISCNFDWTSIRQADGYSMMVGIMGEMPVGDMTGISDVSATTFEQEFKVKALAGDNPNYKDSDWSNSVYSQQRPTPTIEWTPQTTLKITDNSGLGGTYIVYCNGEEFLRTTSTIVKTGFNIADTFAVAAEGLVVGNKAWTRSNISEDLIYSA